jgi:biopolymer transport protein ExbD
VEIARPGKTDTTARFPHNQEAVMDVRKDEQQEEPNVVPLIDISLVVLVMALVISSVAGKLLTMDLPKAPKTQFVQADQTTHLMVMPDGAYQVNHGAKLNKADLAEAVESLQEGTIVLIETEAGAKYEQVVGAIDTIMGRPGLKFALGRIGHASTPAKAPAEVK